MEEFPCCPICELPVPALQMQRHANAHFEEDHLSADMELARQLALAPPTPLKSVGDGLIQCENDHVPAETSSSSVSKLKGNDGLSEGREIAEQICVLVRLQSRAIFHKFEGGLMTLLKNCLESETECSTSILSGYTDHFQSTNSEDKGWGCGWRNIQMLSSHLLMQRPEAKEVLFGGCGFVPDIGSLQRWLEVAWGKGFDVVGSSDFGRRVYGTNKWIGTTECAALFRSFGLRAKVIDFDGKIIANSVVQEFGPMDKFVRKRKLNKGHDSHRRNDSLAKKSKGYQILIDWVWNYFSDHSPMQCGRRHVGVTNKMPLYFQHDGHSRTVVGIQVKWQKNGEKQYNLLVLDPGHRSIDVERSLKANAGWQQLIKRGVHTLKKPQYQLCYVDPDIAHGEELEQLKTTHSVLLRI